MVQNSTSENVEKFFTLLSELKELSKLTAPDKRERFATAIQQLNEFRNELTGTGSTYNQSVSTEPELDIMGVLIKKYGNSIPVSTLELEFNYLCAPTHYHNYNDFEDK